MNERKAREEAEHQRLEEDSAEEQIFQVVEQPAEFPGGTQAMHMWLSENLKYPMISQEKGSQGTVILRFVVDKRVQSRVLR